MNKVNELILALGYEVQLEDKLNNRVRYSGEDNFVDVWSGKKGITIGVYNPKTGGMKYTKFCNLEDIEDAICG